MRDHRESHMTEHELNIEYLNTMYSQMLKREVHRIFPKSKVAEVFGRPVTAEEVAQFHKLVVLDVLNYVEVNQEEIYAKARELTRVLLPELREDAVAPKPKQE